MRVKAWVMVAAVFVGVAAARGDGRFVNLGPQIRATPLIGTTFAKDAEGKELVCTVMRGQPAKLVVFEVKSGKMIRVMPLEGADGAWNATVARDGTVYVGTDSNGHLYSWRPGEEQVKDVGRVGSEQTWVWDLAPGDGDSVIVSTYPGCRVVRYSPGEGLREISNGPASEGEQYARTLVRDEKTGKIYVGVGSHAHLVELDPATGRKVEMLPAEYRTNEFVYGLGIFGGKLFASLTNSGKGLVIDPVTRRVEAELPEMNPQLVMTKSPVEERVYYVAGGKLWTYDIAKPKEGSVEVGNCPDALALSWEKEDNGEWRLLVFTRTPTIVRYDVRRGVSEVAKLEQPKEPVTIQSIALGPDGRIWTGGYLAGGNAAYDPKTGKTTQYGGQSQSESMTVLGDRIYFGIYPHGRFSYYDTKRPWEGRRNPRQIGKIEGQSRPIGAVGVRELNKVFFGTVPEYGTLGGGIAEVDGGTDKIEFYPGVVAEQSVISLVYSHGLIVGGTSVWGGLGMKPSQKEARLFLWDPKEHKKVWETAVEGAPVIGGLVEGPDGKVWGVAGGTLFCFEVEKREIERKMFLFDPGYQPERADKAQWRGAFLVWHSSGSLYGSLDGKLFRVEGKRMDVLRDKGVFGLAMDREGRMYFRDRGDLWQYLP